MTTILVNSAPTKYDTMDRAALIEAARAAGFDRPNNAKTDDLKSFLNEKFEGAKPKKVVDPRLQKASDDYAAARERVRNAVENSSKALAAKRATPNEQTTAAYAKAKEEHKAAIAHIKQVRPIYKQLKIELDQAE